MPERRPTRVVNVGDIGIGGDNPVRVQSMITAQTQDIDNAVPQIKRLHLAGAEIVRVTTPTIRDAQALADIKQSIKGKYQDVPLVADVHHKGTEIAQEASKHVEKVRINPGLFVHHRRSEIPGEYSEVEIERQREEIDRTLAPLLDSLRDRGVALRIGVNHGSLSDRLLVTYGDTLEGMVQSAMEYLKACENRGFKDVVVSLKASRVPIMQEANHLMAKRMKEAKMDYPIHLGVTEAGRGQPARIKSAIGIGSLLTEGIGDTIRVSLTEDPVKELSVAYDILQATGARRTKAEFIACPGCGRAQFDIEEVLIEAEKRFGHLPLFFGDMGCIVNGPGEMRDVNYGIVGRGGGKIALYRKQEEVSIVDQKDAMAALESLIRADGRWIDTE